MSFETALAAARAANLDATLAIEGIPVLFGTRTGLVLDTSGLFVSGSPASMTSVAGFRKDSLAMGGATIDYDMMMIPPSAGGVEIPIDPRWNRFFEPRRAPRTFVTGDFSQTATSFNVSSTAGFAAGDVIHVNRESMLVNTLSATAFTSVSRNYAALPGSKAAKHFALSEVTRSPQILAGRLAVIHLWLNRTEKVLWRRVRIHDIKPDPRKGVWMVSLDDIMSLFDKPIAVGFKGDKVSAISNVDATGDIRITLATAANREFATSSILESHLAIGGGSGPGTVAQITANSGLGTVDVKFTPAYLTFGQAAAFGPGSWTSVFPDQGHSVRRVQVFKGSPMLALLQVLLSNRGDGDNHATYDVLFGITSTSTSGTRELAAGDVECRFGAAIPAALIDIATLSSNEFMVDQPAGWFYVLGSEGEENLLQLIEEVGRALSVIFFINADGKFSCKRIAGTFATTAIAANLNNRTDIANDSELISHLDEREAVHTFHIKCNRDPFGKDFLGEVNVQHQPTMELYREIGRKVSWELRGLIVRLDAQTWERIAFRFGATVPTTVDDLQHRLYRYFARRQFGILKAKPSLYPRHMLLVPGQVVRITHPDIRAFNGGGLDNAPMEIVSTGALDFGRGQFDIEVHETWTGKLINPTGRLSSFNSITNTATLQTNDKFTGVATPGDFFAVGWKVRLLDFSASPPFSVASTVQTVLAKTSTTVQLTGPALGFVPTTGDILVPANYDDADNATQNVQQGLAQRDYVFMSDSNFLLGTANAPADTWG